MNEAVAASSPLSGPRSRAATASAPRGVFWLCAAACVFTLLTNVFRRPFFTGDEGFYGVTALNMVQSPEYLLRPSYFPAGDFATDKAGFAHPPFNSYLYAFGLWLGRGSLAGPEIVHALALAALLFFAYRVLALWDRRAAVCAALLLAASPAMLAAYSLQEAEPLMTTCGIAGLYCCLRGGGRRWFFLGGLCLGLAFAFKLWLCAPLVLAAATAIVLGPATVREKTFALGLAVLGGLVPSAAHLGVIAWLAPQDLGFWLRDIYFGIFTSAGISGSKLSGSSTPAEWMHPVWYYAAALYRDHFFLAPMLLFGLRPLLRERALRGRPLLVIAAGLAGLLPLSAMKVKEPLYVLSCTVFLYLLAGCCLATIGKRLASPEGLDARSRLLGTIGTLGLLLVFPLAYLRHVQPDKITGGFVLAHSLWLGGLLAAIHLAQRRRAAAVLPWALVGGCVATLAVHFAAAWSAPQPRAETIARAVMPAIAENPPGALSFIASNFKGYQYYTYRRGCYWHELPSGARPEALLASAPFAAVRVFILDGRDQRRPEVAPWLRWLEAHTTEKTRNFVSPEESVPPVRVFVRET